MKVSYTLPVNGMFRISETGFVKFPGVTFGFIEDEKTGYVNSFVMTILDVPKENWPTLIPVEQDPEATIKRFPFDVNPKALSFTDYAPMILNLESLLSLIGLEKIEIEMVRVEWIPDVDDEPVGIFSGYEKQKSEREPDCEPVSDITLAKIVVASNGEETETGGLAHFRVASNFFYQERYIDAIRYSYLAIEYLYANGHHKKQQTLKELNASSDLVFAINLTLKQSNALSVLNRLQTKYPTLKTPVAPSSLLEWAYNLRGNIQHGNPRSPRRWHPSRQEDFKDECLLLLNLALEACRLPAERKVDQVAVTN